MASSFSIHFHVVRLVIFSIFDRNAGPHPFSTFSLPFSFSMATPTAFLADKLDSIIANHDGRDDSHVVDRCRPAGRGKCLRLSTYFAMVYHCRVKLDTEGHREEIDFVDIAFLCERAPMNRGYPRKLITAPAAHHIVITPRLSSPSVFTSRRHAPRTLQSCRETGLATHYLDIIFCCTDKANKRVY